MKKILRLRHWQLFLIMVGVPIIDTIIFCLIFISDLSNFFIRIEPFVFLPSIIFFIIWVWEIVMVSKFKIAEINKFKYLKFKMSIFFVIIYLGILSWFIQYAFSEAMQNGFGPNPALLGIVIPLNFLFLYCYIYLIYFASKIIKSFELQREAILEEYIGYSFLLFIIPLGIWIIAPKINKLFEFKKDLSQ